MATSADIIKLLGKKVRAAALEGLVYAAEDIESSGRKVVKTWKHKVDFGHTVVNGQKRIEVTVKPKGSRKNLKVWGYVELGTKPHKIPKVIKPGRLLKFRTGYSAKTMAVAKHGVGTGRSFGQWMSKAQISHPGSEARKFLETYMDELSPPLEQRVNNEIRRVT